MTKSIFKFQLLGVFAMLVLLFTACEKTEDLDEGHLPDNTQNFVGAFTSAGDANSVDSTDIDVLCFEFNYPISVTFPGGETTSFENEETLWTAIDDWYENNPNSEEDPGVVFPVTVTFEDGTTETVTNDEELCDLYYECYDDWEDEEEWEDYEEDEWEEECPDDYHDACFEVVFPISIMVGDDTYTVNSFDEADSLVYGLIDTMDQDDDLDIELVYPINVVLDDGTPLTIATDDDLDELEDTCEDDYLDEGFDLCFSIEYPITILLPDGTSVVANNEEDVEVTLDNWYQNNPDSNVDIYPEFPITVTTMDSITQELPDIAAFDALLATCD